MRKSADEFDTLVRPFDPDSVLDLTEKLYVALESWGKLAQSNSLAAGKKLVTSCKVRNLQQLETRAHTRAFRLQSPFILQSSFFLN